MSALSKLATVIATVVLAGCGLAKPTTLPKDLQSPYTGYASPQYREPTKWLCLPGRADPCNHDLTATEMRADGTSALLPQAIAESPAIDCFYVYPTMDLRLRAANQEDFTDVSGIVRATNAQAALFGQVCSLYVPLYRQVSIGTYFTGEQRREAGLAVAFSDVADAFLHYMGTYNRGRKIVLLGHSQGAEMVKRLLQRFFDDDPSMRERLLLAMPIGGDFEAPIGKTTGGTFRNVPYCTKDDEVGCVVADRSHRDASDVPSTQSVPPGHEAICVNPANLAERGERAPLHAFFPKYGQLAGQDALTTPYVFYRDLYTGRCVEGPKGKRVLEIAETAEPDGLRKSPIDLSTWRWGTRMGTHVADFQFPQGDLVELVRRRVRTGARR